MGTLNEKYPWCTYALDDFDPSGFKSGWHGIMDRLLKDIAARYEAAAICISPENFSISQAKEKFGRLRVYVGIEVDIFDLRQQAEEESARTCMTCGAMGSMVVSGCWWHVVCDKHKSPGDLTPAEALKDDLPYTRLTSRGRRQ